MSSENRLQEVKSWRLKDFYLAHYFLVKFWLSFPNVPLIKRNLDPKDDHWLPSMGLMI